MSRMPIDQRRDQLVSATLAVATREGLERTTMRAIAAEAGVALGVLHYCFTDKAELMRAVARHIHKLGLSVVLAAAGSDPDHLMEDVVAAYADMITGSRPQYLLQHELTVASLRDPELAGVAAEQLATKLANAQMFLEVAGATAALSWTVPVEELARRLVIEMDGAVLAWLVDRDDAALRVALSSTGRSVRALGREVPRPAATASPLP
jgi:AcrR family transcriptional regulator